VFQREIRDLIPESRNPIAAIAHRIVLDLSNVAYVDSSGLGALWGAWTAARDKGGPCDLEIANLNPRVEKLVEITKLDTVFKRGRIVAAGGFPSTTPGVEGSLTALDPEEACQQGHGCGDGRSPCRSAQLRDLHPRIDRRRGNAECEVLRS